MDHPHLTQDELMQAAADETQLPAQAREHLLVCVACKERKLKSAARLGTIQKLSGQISRQSKPWYRFRSGEAENSAARPFGIKFMLIIAVLAVLMLIFNLYGPFRNNRDQEPAPSTVDIVDPQNAFSSIDPLPEIYVELLNNWWRKDALVKGLGLTPKEIGHLDIAWKEAVLTQIKLKKALADQQVELIIALEKKQWDEEAVQHHFHQLSHEIAQSAKARFLLLLNMRRILGHERFQKLLLLLK